MIFTSIQSQDTVWVQTFDYGSTSRDSMIQFPSGDHHQYEKILMYYSMRCRDGLISTGTERNKGCGEWDYSCNTNVIDSSGLDSLKAIHPNYVINGLSDNFFIYRISPTYNYYEFEQTNISSSGGNPSFTNIGIHQGNDLTNWSDQAMNKVYYWVKSSEIAGLSAGSIAGLQLETTAGGNVGFMKIKMANATEEQFKPDMVGTLDFTEVLNRDISFTGSGLQNLIFHQTFLWSGNQDIIIEISYTGDANSLGNLVLKSTKAGNTAIGPVSPDKYLVFSSDGMVDIPTTSMKDISSQITIAFWSNGNENILPVNNSIFTAVDNNGKRQLNVHLPWSNSRIYWDCGNDGSDYDRIDKAALNYEFEGTWNHWAFTKNTGSGSMKIYLNGQLWHSASGKYKPIDIEKFVLGGDVNGTNSYFGSVDDFAVWSTELTQSQIQSIMFQAPHTVAPVNDKLVAYYDFNDPQSVTFEDLSGYQSTANATSNIIQRSFRGANIFKAFIPLDSRPDMAFIRGNYNISSQVVTKRDSIENPPIKVIPYTVSNNVLIKGDALYYWEAGIYPVYNEDGDIIDEVAFYEDDVLEIEDLEYYNKFPSKYELLSFVTPYGIGLDFGLKGKTWIFDVTDYGPILKNRKRFLMDKGGERQEEMDIKFAFIKGTPTRNVLNIQQVWPVTSYGYTGILSNASLETRELFAENEVKSIKIRTVATGHGQEGEFIARNHSINVNGGIPEFEWSLWKECADNPIYPQGGTWVYDRAGWCPGAPSDLREFEIMPLVNAGQRFSLDYQINTASGDSRYIVNTQLVKYGDPNFNNDGAILEIVSPSSSAKYQRVNPICASPSIIIQNNGKNDITEVEISFGIEGTTLSTFTWKGKLTYLQSQTVVLPNLSPETWYAGNRFKATILSVNNKTDDYAPNNVYYSSVIPADHLDGDIIIAMRTNNQGNETRWTLKDDLGNLIRSSKTNLSGGTVYLDTIKNLSGCYKLQFTDSDDDGISWWANGDGDGYIRAKGSNGAWKFFQPDFGKELTYYFTTGMINASQDINKAELIKIYPNPAHDEAIIEMEGLAGQTTIQVYRHTGELIHTEIIRQTQPEYHNTTIDLSNHSAGLYLINISNGSSLTSRKIVKI